MPRFEATITETIRQMRVPTADDEPTPVARSVRWVGEARDQDAAKEAADTAWDEKYGPGKQPVQAIVKVTPLEG